MRTLIALALVATSSAALAARARVTTTNDFKVGSKPVVIVESDGGGVEVAAGPAGTVHIEAERQADSEDDARKLDVTARADGNTVRVAFHSAHRGWHESANVSFRITAPADTRLEVRTGGGGVGVTGLGGGILVNTGGGGVEISDAAGPLKLRSGGGSIEVRRVSGPVDVETGGGSVRVEGALSGKNRVETGGGSIHVAVPESSKLAVDASTGGGSASNDFGIPGEGERHSGRFHGNIGDGSGGTLELRTGGGSIRLSKR